MGKIAYICSDMNLETIREIGLGLPYVSERLPFGPDTLVLEIGGKMFCLLDLSGECGFYSVKCAEEKGVELRERYAAIRPGFHLNKRKWLSVDFHGDVPERLHRELVVGSYREVLRGMSRVKRLPLTRLEVRRAVETDADDVLRLIAGAKIHLRREGNNIQWTGEYPGREVIDNDIALKRCMVVEHCGDTVGTFCMLTEADPTYSTLPADMPYATLHRVAGSPGIAGITERAVEYALGVMPEVRIDTHVVNAPMLKAIKRMKMGYLGEITLADGTPRVVYMLRR